MSTRVPCPWQAGATDRTRARSELLGRMRRRDAGAPVSPAGLSRPMLQADPSLAVRVRGAAGAAHGKG